MFHIIAWIFLKLTKQLFKRITSIFFWVFFIYSISGIFLSLFQILRTVEYVGFYLSRHKISWSNGKRSLIYRYKIKGLVVYDYICNMYIFDPTLRIELCDIFCWGEFYEQGTSGILSSLDTIAFKYMCSAQNHFTANKFRF